MKVNQLNNEEAKENDEDKENQYSKKNKDNKENKELKFSIFNSGLDLFNFYI